LGLSEIHTQIGTQANNLLVIDELNRADIDKAFGQLFTLLSGQSVQLPYTVDGQEVELTSYEDLEEETASLEEQSDQEIAVLQASELEGNLKAILSEIV